MLPFIFIVHASEAERHSFSVPQVGVRRVHGWKL
ncbi:hypothetical protein ID866_4219 [Astraeus odoratus]|nr:hypothetical protein ID866_4219 [Astraeus odoratus]